MRTAASGVLETAAIIAQKDSLKARDASLGTVAAVYRRTFPPTLKRAAVMLFFLFLFFVTVLFLLVPNAASRVVTPVTKAASTGDGVIVKAHNYYLTAIFFCFNRGSLPQLCRDLLVA